MKLYDYLTGPDDSAFSHRVTERLNHGWQLYGSPAMTYSEKIERIICGQALTKEAEGDYSIDIELSEE